MTPRRLGAHELGEVLGRGAAGTVFRATGPRGEVAIKLLETRDESALLRFDRERRLLDALGEGFVPLLEAGFAPEGPYLVMPLVRGGTLRERLARGPLDIEEARALGRALAVALGRAHEKGIVHRDVKPGNVLFTEQGEPLIADLGIAKHF